VHNREVDGALASLSAVAKLQYESCLDGTSNTLFCIVLSALGKDNNRKQNLANLPDGYFGKGGHHISVNVLNQFLLEDAHLHPHEYPNLTIRVSGYAVRFNQLTPEQRREVLKRTMHGASAWGFDYKQVKCLPEVSRESLAKENPKPSNIDIEDLVQLAYSKLVNGVVHSIEAFSTSDGPEVRTIAFLQGCAKQCILCRNFETQCFMNLERVRKVQRLIQM